MVKKSEPNGSCFFFGRQMPLCGCGEPDAALDLIKKVLDATQEGNGVHWLALYALDRAKLIDHGGSIHYSYLTDKGSACLAYLREHGTDSGAWDHDTKIEWEELEE